jgi:hypothetical protein
MKSYIISLPSSIERRKRIIEQFNNDEQEAFYDEASSEELTQDLTD